MELNSNDPLTLDIIESGCVTWEDLVRSVRNFKYGRGTNRGDFEGVWYQRMGTCSTKHGFLYKVAQLNGYDSVELMVGMYLMTANNTPKVTRVLEQFQLDGIPEAHCYLKIGAQYLDATSNHSSYELIAADLMHEQKIEPEFLVSEKVDFHRKFFETWNHDSNSGYSDEELWSIREQCIEAMS